MFFCSKDKLLSKLRCSVQIKKICQFVHEHKSSMFLCRGVQMAGSHVAQRSASVSDPARWLGAIVEE